jgi:hypothetical protein
MFTCGVPKRDSADIRSVRSPGGKYEAGSTVIFRKQACRTLYWITLISWWSKERGKVIEGGGYAKVSGS